MSRSSNVAHSVRAGTRVSLEIDRLTLGGEGVGRLNGLAVFVPYGAPGDQIEAEIVEARPRFARATLIRVLRPSPDRIAPPCPYHFSSSEQRLPRTSRSCGGCTWQHLRYEAQLKAKRALVQETLERLGGLRDVPVKPVLGMSDPWRYRNKVQQPVGWDAERRRLISGFYAPGTHDIMPIDDCLVQPEQSVAIVNKAKALLEQFHLRAYDSKTHQGWIRHLLIRTVQGQSFLTFISRTPDFPHEHDIVAILVREFPALAGIYQNVNPAATNVIVGHRWRKLVGADYIEERLGRLRFRLSPGSFFQVNSRQAEVLYETARAMAGSGERLLDLFCGVGGIALWLADRFQEVGGIEEVPSAIEDAEINAEINNIRNVRFQAAPVEGFLRRLGRQAGGSRLTVTLDPPRAGCSPAVLKSLLILAPRRIVYVSCDPGTLARDLGVLVKGGYRIDEVQPVDMFPQTSHIETAVKMTRG